MNTRPTFPRRSTSEFIREARRTPGYTLADFIHGYIYARWPYLYISAATGEHRPSPLLQVVGWVLGPLVPGLSSPGITVADAYHGKVVPLEAAKQLVSVKQEVRLTDLEHIIPYALARDIVLHQPGHIVALECPCRAARANPCLPLDVYRGRNHGRGPGERGHSVCDCLCRTDRAVAVGADGAATAALARGLLGHCGDRRGNGVVPRLWRAVSRGGGGHRHDLVKPMRGERPRQTDARRAACCWPGCWESEIKSTDYTPANPAYSTGRSPARNAACSSDGGNAGRVRDYTDWGCSAWRAFRFSMCLGHTAHLRFCIGRSTIDLPALSSV
jgi:hypothetical protein